MSARTRCLAERDERQVSVSRIIGIRHRVKRTAEGKARPTQVTIETNGKKTLFDLATETDELDFVLGRYPTAYRPYADGEDLSGFLKRQLKTKTEGEGDDAKTVILKVSSEFDGLQTGDEVVMVLGGSGDRFAFALSKRGEKIGASVHRLPSFELNARRGEVSKDDDSSTLVRIFRENPELFYEVGVRDRELIQLKEAFYGRAEAQRARIGCEQRLGSRVIGKIFLSEEGLYPDGLLEDACDAEKATDAILKGLVKEEKRRDAELKFAVHRLYVWREIFVGIEGVGETIAAGVIVAVGDIRRFKTDVKLKKFLGVHVQSDGRFPRKRVGTVANWHPRGRQALYLLAGQFIYRPDSVWGLKLREYKAKFRAKHPVVECSTCDVPWDKCRKKVVVETTEELEGEKHTRRYTDGHIHKMAMWRTLTKFVEALHRDWSALEKRRVVTPSAEEPAA